MDYQGLIFVAVFLAVFLTWLGYAHAHNKTLAEHCRIYGHLWEPGEDSTLVCEYCGKEWN